MRRAASLTALLVIGLAACRGEGPPSADYAQARAEFARLYGEQLEDAYLDPGMEEVEAMLERVPESSRDALRARALLTRIRSGRERVEGQREEREELRRLARTPVGSGRFEDDPPDAGEPDGGDLDAGEATDAGVEQPLVGMPIAELSSRFGDCFLPDEPIAVAERGQRPTWRLRGTMFCALRHPGFEKKFLVEEEGRVLLVADLSQIEMVVPGRGVSKDAG